MRLSKNTSWGTLNQSDKIKWWADEVSKLSIPHGREVECLSVYYARVEALHEPEIAAADALCVEEAISLTIGEPFSDTPTYVQEDVRVYSVRLNDANWLSTKSRAAGMRDLAIAQLGSAGVVDGDEFAARITELTIRELIPALFRSLRSATPSMLAAADRCEAEGTAAAAYAARGAAYRGAIYTAGYASNEAHAAHKAYRACGDADSVGVYAAYAAEAADYANTAATIDTWGTTDRFLLLAASLAVRALHELGSPGAALLP